MRLAIASVLHIALVAIAMTLLFGPASWRDFAVFLCGGFCALSGQWLYHKFARGET